MKKTKTVTGNTENKKPESPPAPPVAKQRQHGPLKEKTQITVRIDTELMDRAYAQIKQDNVRITDVIEEGLVLALEKRDQDMPRLTSQVRFLVANATKQQQQLLRKFMIFMVLGECEDLNPTEALLHEMVLRYLGLMEQGDRYQRAMELYSRYGRGVVN